MTNQIKSKQRTRDHGEVFTRPEEVNAMLDLIYDETVKKDDATYLEPACGTGNFLIEILKRRLAHVQKKYVSSKCNRSQRHYEFYAIKALAGIYGIELLEDNVLACRQRLFDYFVQQYQLLFSDLLSDNINPKVIEISKFILKLNILHGDALTMKYADRDEFLCFSQWSSINFPRPFSLKRHVFRYSELVNGNGNPYQSIAEYQSCYFLDIKNAKLID